MDAEEIADVIWELMVKLPDEAQAVFEDIIDQLWFKQKDANFYPKEEV